MQPKITYHLRLSGTVAVCGAVSLYPSRAVVDLGLFRKQTKSYTVKCCPECRKKAPR